MVPGSTAFAIHPLPLPHHVSCYSKTIIRFCDGLILARIIDIWKAISGSSTRALYTAIVCSVTGLWCSNNGGVPSYTQLDNTKTRFSLTPGMVFAVDPRMIKR
jgi:hypothetical protein